MTDIQDSIPEHADFQRAPGVLEGAMTYELSPHECGIDFWIKHVAQGALMGLDRGKRPESTVPGFLREAGHPLHENLVVEFAFRSLSEWQATRICAAATTAAPDIPGMEFFATQTLDEARHAQTFRCHLIDLGVPEDELHDTVQRVAGGDAERIFTPLETWCWGKLDAERAAGRGHLEFIGIVAVITILLEGVLAPTTELSERKWKPISPATADIERGACVDEIRHLSVGSWIIREHLLNHPADKDFVVGLIADGRELWNSLPTVEIIYAREQLYQQGIELIPEVIGDYEIEPGVRLLDTGPQERLLMALRWSNEVQAARLKYMGVAEALPEDLRL